VLAEAGLVEVEKGYEGRRPRTWVRITRAGRRALTAEMTTLAFLVRRHDATARAPASTRATPRFTAEPREA
jgi:DNA-binding PadR family transcriptional regulator